MIPARSRIAKMKSRPYTVAKLVPTIDDGGGPIADVTPNAVNWGNVGYNATFGEYIYTQRQVSGINQTITLRLTFTGGGMYYMAGPTDGVGIGGGDMSTPDDPIALGMNGIATNGTFTVQNNWYVAFGNSGDTSNFTVTVVNTSNGNATLDTFNNVYTGVP